MKIRLFFTTVVLLLLTGCSGTVYKYNATDKDMRTHYRSVMETVRTVLDNHIINGSFRVELPKKPSIG